MIKYQLAVQGGGARLADLLCALSVIQDYEKSNRLQITAGAGTSAGALAVAIYACGNDSCVRALSYLNSRAPLAAKTIMPPLTLWGLTTRIAPWIMMKKAVCDESKVKNEIQLLFDHLMLEENKNLTINDLLTRGSNIEQLHFITTNMNTKKAVSRTDPSEHLIQSLFDSCAIPYVFKGARDDSPYIDGGLCENLPSDFLSPEPDASERVLAVSFEAAAVSGSRHNNLSYLRELFSTAIDHSVDRARSVLPPHSILSLNTKTATFDFSTAFNQKINSESFMYVRQKTTTWLEKNIEIDENQAENKIISFNKGNYAAERLMDRLYRWYDAKLSKVERHVFRDVTIVDARSLARPEGDPYQNLDLLKRIYEFRPKKEPITAMHFPVSTYDQDRHVLFDFEHRIEVFGPDRKKIAFEAFPTVHWEPDTHWGYLILFDEPLVFSHDKKDGGGKKKTVGQGKRPDGRNSFYRIVYQTYYPDVLSGLRKKRKDVISKPVRNVGKCDKSIIVLHAPKNMNINCKATWKASGTGNMKPLDVTGADKEPNWALGGAPNMKTFVWVAKDLKKDGLLKVDLEW